MVTNMLVGNGGHEEEEEEDGKPKVKTKFLPSSGVKPLTFGAKRQKGKCKRKCLQVGSNH
jgi:hypothetical protein